MHTARFNFVVLSMTSLICRYHILPSKRHGHLKVTGQKTGVGTYTEKPLYVQCIYAQTIGLSKMGGGRLHRDGLLLGRIQ